jgi:hypothetical protein
MKNLLCLVFLLLFPGLTWAIQNPVYISQSGGSPANGTSCADAYSASWFNTAGNWGAGAAQIGPGTTVHLCETITSELTAKGSGSAGLPITVLWETGASLTLSTCDQTNGCFNIANLNYIILDGGTTCGYVNGSPVVCNGSIQATAAGSGLTDSTGYNAGIIADNCQHCEVRNLLISNIYQHTSVSDDALSGSPYAIGVTTTGNYDLKLHNLILHDAGTAVQYIPGTGDAGFQLYNSDMYNNVYGVAIAGSNSLAKPTQVLIHDNHIHDSNKWDATGCPYHEGGIHGWSCDNNIPACGAVISGLSVYNNLFDGNFGACLSSLILMEGNSTNSSLYNNAFVPSAYGQANSGLVCLVGTNWTVDNNTVVGLGASSHCMSLGIGWTGSSITSFQNNIISNCGTDLIVNQSPAALGASNTNWNNNLYTYGTDPWTFQGTPASWYSTIANWRTYSGVDSNSTWYASPSSLLLNSNGSPQVTSPAIGVGANLTSLGITALDSDIIGTARPSGGACPGVGCWDIGAYEYTSGVITSGPYSTGTGPVSQGAGRIF